MCRQTKDARKYASLQLQGSRSEALCLPLLSLLVTALTAAARDFLTWTSLCEHDGVSL